MGVILALQSSGAVHLGVDNLGVVRHVGRLLDGHHGSVPLELVKDGDLLLLLERMLHRRGLDTARITEVKGHADEGMVLDGRVREQDRVGNNAADEAGLFFLPGPPGIWDSEWISVPASAVSAEDVAHWPYTVRLLVQWLAFLCSLHWPVGGANHGVGGVSFVEMLILYVLWAGERLTLDKAHPRYRQASASNFSVGCSLWSSH